MTYFSLKPRSASRASYCSVVIAGSTTAASPVWREARRYEAHPQRSSSICLKYIAQRYSDPTRPSAPAPPNSGADVWLGGRAPCPAVAHLANAPREIPRGEGLLEKRPPLPQQAAAHRVLAAEARGIEHRKIGMQLGQPVAERPAARAGHDDIG